MSADLLDLLLRGATVFDGRGRPPVVCDVGLAEGRIQCMGPDLAIAAREERDVRGLWLLPGFVDIHTHYDLEVEVTPGLHESVRHGVTTVVMGHCSLSLTMGEPNTLADIFLRTEALPPELVRKWLAGAATWRTPESYLEHLRALPLGPNVVAMLGHSALRAVVMGLERSLGAEATDDELARMQRLAEDALDAGCAGISVDMVFWHRMTGKFAGRSVPSHHAALREVRMLATVCRERDLVFQVTPDPRRPRTVLDLLGLGLGIFRPPLRTTMLAALDIVHHAWAWRMYGLITRAANTLLGGNLRFQTLTEPFTMYADGPITPLLDEFDAGVQLGNLATAEERRALWKEAGFRETFREQWKGDRYKSFHRDLAQMVVVDAPDPGIVGRSFAQIGAARGQPAVDTFMDLLEEHDAALRHVATGANHRQDIRERLMRHPHILPGFTDAGAHCRSMAFQDGALSLLRQAMTTGFLTPEAAIRRVTSEPARWFRLDAGVLRPGARADLVLLRPELLQQPIPAPFLLKDETLDGAMRMVKRSGPLVAHVFVAGAEVVRDGEPLPVLGQRPLGALLSPPLPASVATVQRWYRDRIDDDNMGHPFEDYWDIFVMKHRHPANVALHCAAVAMMLGIGAMLVLTRSPWWLLAVPVSQLVGTVGHWLFEPSYVDPRDLVFSRRASRALWTLFFRVVTGRYWSEVARVEGLLRTWQESRP